MPDREGTIEYRLQDHKTRLEKLEEIAGSIPVMQEQMKQLDNRMGNVTKALWSVAVALIITAISVIFATGGIGG